MYDDLRAQAYEANMLLPQLKLIDLSFGNVSVIDRNEEVIAIKPSGVPYEQLTPEMIVIVDRKGNTVDSELKPSSDTTTHLRLYEAFEAIGGVVHTHSRYATSFAQAGKSVPCYGTTHADYFYGDIPLARKLSAAEVEDAYELETGNVIVERFRDLDPEVYPGVLVRSHGPFAWGKDGKKAVENAYVVELLAEMAYHSTMLNPSLTPIDQYLLDKHYKRKHGKDAYYGQNG